MTKILGISCYYHDSSVSLIENGNIVFALQEERFSRLKHDSSFPQKSIKYLLNQLDLKINDIDYIVFHEKPFLKFERLLETYLKNTPRGLTSFLKAMPLWIKQKIFQKKILTDELKKIEPNLKLKNDLLFSQHHLSHAASAFYPSPFSDAAILTLDGVGEWSTSTISIGDKNKIDIKEEIFYPHSIGLLYSAVTYFCGFEVNGGEYKLMGLAPYGKPIYKKAIYDNLIQTNSDGGIFLNMKYFDFDTGLKMTSDKFNELFKCKPRQIDEKINQFYMDLASSVQEVTEELILKICRYIKKKYEKKNLCLAGGVALNCVANGKIVSEKIFDNLWIQPASSDAGGSLGAALSVWFDYLDNDRSKDINFNQDNMKRSLLGSQYSNNYIKNFLENNEINYEYCDGNEIFTKAAQLLNEKKIIALFQGRMEFGPRALGNRSILGDPRDPEMQKKMNLKIKYRESFRPFAPIILRDFLEKYYYLDQESPYMLLVSEIKKEFRKIYPDNLNGFDKLSFSNSIFPAITHVDYSSRLQTIDETNNYIHRLLNSFYNLTECPLLINTSFNIKDEPIVESPEDAYRCFKSTEIDILILENFIIKK